MKTHVIASIDTGKSMQKIQHDFMTKSSQYVRCRMYLNKTKHYIVNLQLMSHLKNKES